MKKIYYLIILALILSLILTGCSLLSNVGQVPTTGQSGITYLTKNGLLPGLVGLWRFDGDATDSSGNSNSGAVYQATYVNSPMGQALSFDGENDYVNVLDTNSSLDVDTITIEAWIYFDEKDLLKVHRNLVRKGYYGDRCYGLSIGLRAAGEIAGWINLGPSGGSGALVARGSVLSPGFWHHVAMTYDGEVVRVYVDGAEDGISTTVSGDIFDNNLSMRIGGQPVSDKGGALAFKGLIDEVRIWNTALTEDQLGDITPPIITMLGTSPVTVEVGSTYTDAGATALDNVDGDITANIATGNPVNTGVLGTYMVTYDVSDAAGNSAIQVTRTVNVVDTTLPVITLVGATPVNVEVGSTYTDAGATAWDNYDGDITGSIVTVNSVNTAVMGNYTVTYNLTDSSGNAAETVTRTVNVIYNWTGFFRPVDNLPMCNAAKAGRAIPVKFSLNGNQGLEIFEVGYPRSEDITCGSIDLSDGIEETVTAGKSSLSYDADADQYIYVWKTEKAWVGNCRQLVVKLIDGTSHFANFHFTK